MNLVAIETATSACAVAVRTRGGDEFIRVFDEERRHNEVLSEAIAQLLDEAAIGVREVDRVIVDRGPGLYTGLRVGLATAIALAQGIGADLVAVTSLETLAWGAFSAGVRGRLVACVDARRGEIFTQLFELGDGAEQNSAPRVARARNVVIEWATNGAPVTFSGDGVERYLSDFAAVPNGVIHHQAVPSIRAALSMGARRVVEGAVVPLYLREADAVANFTTRERPQ
ncbi:MAG: tRNA (adenosine(37)-N6)-threonylcarbamoyltransferase complex dimerization subunit type 1 TsaB [Acidimicrobiaceae bacterium]|nr:tRNA (adenosine(37)-N6)-threonylcarbamoyltransferase complex dimerization subunit type 1 TsaB [Acidimicrobiaceae bacterium]